MSKIPTPDRGQPIDASYLYQIVEAINEIAAINTASTYKYAAIDTSNGQSNSLITETKVVAGEKIVIPTLTSVAANSTQNFSYNFKGEFKFPPIVTATPVLIDGTSSGQEVSVVLQNISTSRVDGVVKFNTGGQVAVKIHIIAIGVPRS